MAEQKMRISDVELEILKSTFADRDELLKTIRNLFYGLEMTDDEKKQIKDTFSGELLRKLMRKQFLPELQKDIPIGQCVDLWMTIDIKDKTPEQIVFIVNSRGLLIEMIDKALALLENPNGDKVNLDAWKEATEKPELAGTNLSARNIFASHVDQQLLVIKTLAGLTSETVEETKARMMKNSSK